MKTLSSTRVDIKSRTGGGCIRGATSNERLQHKHPHSCRRHQRPPFQLPPHSIDCGRIGKRSRFKSDVHRHCTWPDVGLPAVRFAAIECENNQQQRRLITPRPARRSSIISRLISSNARPLTGIFPASHARYPLWVSNGPPPPRA